MKSAKKTGVVIVDDHALIRSGLRLLIETRADFLVTGEAGNHQDALKLCCEDCPDVILLDIDLGSENGLDLLPQLLQECPAARVIILTGVRQIAIHEKAIRAGAAGIVLKDKAADVLLTAIEKVHAGEVWLDRALLSKMVREASSQKPDPEASKIARLTPREREIIGLISHGLRNKEIARRLSISETTARHHLSSTFAKLEVSDRLELLIYAIKHGLATPLQEKD